MTQEEKELLFKDLCGRLPYGVKLDTLEGPQELNTKWLAINMCNIASPYLPYLFPLSSMTDEQERQYSFFSTIIFSCFEVDLCEAVAEFHDWFNRNHIDYRGLIEKSLALDATNLGIYE